MLCTFLLPLGNVYFKSLGSVIVLDVFEISYDL